MLVAALASAQTVHAQVHTHSLQAHSAVLEDGTATPSALGIASKALIPTLTVPQSTPITVPTFTVPEPTPTATPVRHRVVKHLHKAKTAHRASRKAVHASRQAVAQQWVWAYLTSYCPASAGSISSSGQTVFYGMLANDYYAFGTRVYLPVLGITGVVEDRVGAFISWNHFDVWSPICYSTPTGYFRVAIQTR